MLLFLGRCEGEDLRAAQGGQHRANKERREERANGCRRLPVLLRLRAEVTDREMVKKQQASCSSEQPEVTDRRSRGANGTTCACLAQ
jgi:hypothetical protein